MPKQAIKYFRAENSTGYISFDSNSCAEEIFLERKNEGSGRYNLHLKIDQCLHSGLPTGSGTFQVELFSGEYFEGKVLSTQPSITVQNDDYPDEFEFLLVAWWYKTGK